jgi:hypothetical protein
MMSEETQARSSEAGSAARATTFIRNRSHGHHVTHGYGWGIRDGMKKSKLKGD